MTSANDLIKFAKEHLANKDFIAVLFREPYEHYQTPKGIKVKKTVGGVHLLIDGIIKKTGGLMVATGTGSADQETVDNKGKLPAPPSNPSYTLKRVFLTDTELKGFYYGMANQTIWPLFHAVFIKPKFLSSWWQNYVKANKKFANAILEEVKNKEAFVWINDYHFCLVPKLLKAQNPKLKIGVFWHIPWPTHEFFRICPWRKEMLEGLLGADFIGFHRDYHVENFIDCARIILGVLVDDEPKALEFKNHTTKLKALPAGIDFHKIKDSLEKLGNINRNVFKEDLKINIKQDQKLILGVDRIDYTKGLIERFKILDRFFEKFPQWRSKVIYVSVGSPSRMRIPEYKSYNTQLDRLTAKINAKYQTESWQPIHFIKQSLPRENILGYYSLADACLVTSLDDGMNLVAKEFVVSADPKKGVLLLSKFTGAAKDLKQAMLINPYDTDGTANALNEALLMDTKSKEKMNNEMKKTLEENNIYKWGIDFIKNSLS